MTNPFPDLINTRLQPGAEAQSNASRFNGFLAASKPLKRFGACSYRNTGLKPGVNESAPGKLLLLIFLLTLCFSRAALAAQEEDAEYEAVAEEYIKTYLAAHPLEGTALGIHEYDGKISDYSRLALDAELSRLRRFDDRLAKFDPSKLSPRQSIDLRILQAAVKKDLFEMQDMSVFERNPMVYARAADVNVYIKRNFAPLEDRVRSLVAIESQIPNILIAARTNLNEKLPKPFVELAIQIAKGSADFLKKDLIAAVSALKDEQLRLAFQEANRKAANALNDYAAWLEREKLPKASLDFALGEEKFGRFLAQTELVDLPPQKVLEIGMAQLKAEQDAFAEAAKKIDPNKSPIEVFKQIQSEHPAPDKLISDVAKDLDKIRKYVLNRHLVSIPSEVRAKVKETPQYLRATSFASMDTPGPFEKRATEAYYYVTPTEHEWPEKQKQEWLTAFNYYTSDVVSIHEAYPGHYVQFLHLNASPASKVEKIFGSYAFIEGWAHYCEKMMLDEGFGSPTNSPPSEEDVKRAAKYRMAQADEALLRLCRLCVSIKLHTQNMSLDEATKFFHDNCYYEEKPARQEAMRGTFDPGYLNYTLGKLEILKLRDDYKAQQGDEFSLQKFHNEVLNHGMPPIRLLREIMLKDQSKWDAVL
ncbi:MAG: hypothetical protein DME98_10220 [Verrucomicrobia bacterium]|nr:MAG: hypothetical protein DME98_10220 [Verrucomicrobiota bacterium]PYJ34905.1 MAG: hypothetical protein DME88_03505 [Verrucomicrobiota bacterium]